MTNEDLGQEMFAMKAIVERIEHRLFGNGQPGKLQEIDAHLEATDKKVEELMQARSHVKGAAWVVGAILTFVGWPHVVELFKHKP